MKVFSEMFYADVELAPGARVPLPDGHEDRGLYIVSGSVVIGGQSFEAAQMMVFRPGDRLHVTAGPEGARLMLLGGETLGGPRYIWWNFVASSRERIEAAKEAWRAGRLGARALPAAAGRRRRVHPVAAGAGRAGASARGQVGAQGAVRFRLSLRRTGGEPPLVVPSLTYAGPDCWGSFARLVGGLAPCRISPGR